MNRSLTAGLALAFATVLPAEGPYLVKDIHEGADPTLFGASHAIVGDQLFFVAQDPVLGEELWRSDGTEVGTTVVREIQPGDSSGGISQFAAGTAHLFFRAAVAPSPQLWKSDGTEPGTESILSTAGLPLSDPFARGDQSFVARSVDGNTVELLLVEGSDSSIDILASDYWITPLAVAGERLYFRRYASAVSDWELWRSDGTVGTTSIVTAAGALGTEIEHPTPLGDWLYFTADVGGVGRELWRSNGTEAGTAMVADIQPGFGGSSPRSLAPIGGRLLFEADGELAVAGIWSATAATNAAVHVLGIDNDDVIQSGPHAAGGLAYIVFDPNYLGDTLQLWRSDGTVAGTFIVLDAISKGFGYPSRFVDVAGNAYFVIGDGDHGREIWRSNGTAAGTVRITDIVSGSGDADPQLLGYAGGRLFFKADDGLSGRELWALEIEVFSDGFEAGDSCDWSATMPDPGCAP